MYFVLLEEAIQSRIISYEYKLGRWKIWYKLVINVNPESNKAIFWGYRTLSDAETLVG